MAEMNDEGKGFLALSGRSSYAPSTMKWLLLILASAPLSSCIDPYAMNMARDPRYDPHGSQYRGDMRAHGPQLNQMAYQRGMQDGQSDAQRRQSQNYNRHRTRFDRSSEMAYRDGYNQAYSQSNSSLGGGYLQYPTTPAYPQPQSPAPQANSPAYNQGYDYGLRDRAAGRIADPSTHVGRYDPRQRADFERGYHGGYNARSSMNMPSSMRPGTI